jgi:methionine biosynthesis protein MetW
MRPTEKKRQADFQVIAQWVNPGDRVLDLGCGRGVLLEYLKQKKSAYGVGVDIDFDKILSCVKRGVPAYQGDIGTFLRSFPDACFDRVIFSRTVEQLEEPDAIIKEGLRVGRRVAVGFVNRGFWVNRANAFFKGARTVNEVYPKKWYDALPANPFSIAEFEEYCDARQIIVEDRVCLRGDWRSECQFWPNLRAGYAIYDLSSSV